MKTERPSAHCLYFVFCFQVCEYGMEVTNGSVETDVVATSARQKLVIIWVLVKQMLAQQIVSGGNVAIVENEVGDMTKNENVMKRVD